MFGTFAQEPQDSDSAAGAREQAAAEIGFLQVRRLQYMWPSLPNSSRLIGVGLLRVAAWHVDAVGKLEAAV